MPMCADFGLRFRHSYEHTFKTHIYEATLKKRAFKSDLYPLQDATGCFRSGKHTAFVLLLLSLFLMLHHL